jgi:hypothetical protein
VSFIWGGQPPRGSELLGIRWKNTATKRRNIFLVSGRLVLLTTYHKCQHADGMDLPVARFLPLPVTHLLLAYLYYVRPFVILLQQETTGHAVARSPLLWNLKDDADQYWESARLTKILIQQTRKHLDFPFNLAQYRQVTIKIQRDRLKYMPLLASKRRSARPSLHSSYV